MVTNALQVNASLKLRNCLSKIVTECGIIAYTLHDFM